MEVFQNAQVQESLTTIAQETESSRLIQTQHELVDAVISLSFNRPNYVHLIALMDQQRSLHGYGSILLIEPFREQLYELMDSEPRDGSISWRIIEREKPSLVLCRTIRKAKVVTLEPIGFLALLVDTREMLASANILHDSSGESTLIYLNDQLLYQGSLVTDEMLADLRQPEEGYAIQPLAGSRYFITASQPSAKRLRFVTLSSYDQVTNVLHRTQLAVALSITLILIAIFFTSARLSNRILADRYCPGNEGQRLSGQIRRQPADRAGRSGNAGAALPGAAGADRSSGQPESAQAVIRDTGAGQNAAGADTSAFSL